MNPDPLPDVVTPRTIPSIGISQSDAESFFGMSLAMAHAAFARTGARPDFHEPITLDGADRLVSAMPLAAHLCLHNRPRAIWALLCCEGVTRRLALALGCPHGYAEGYWDGWFAEARRAYEEPAYIVGYADAAKARSHFQAAAIGAN